MGDFEKTVFISYRRSVSRFLARAIFNQLKQNGYDVFLDVESINSGDFEEIILQQIGARMHFIVILTDGSVERCIEPEDWLRREIEYAIKVQRNIVPITFGKFDFNENQRYLLGELSKLPRYNALPLYDAYFDEGMQKLTDRFLKPPSYNVRSVAVPAQNKAIIEQRISSIENEPPPTEEQLSAERYYERAYSKFQDGNFQKALEDYNLAIQLHSEYTEAIYQRALTYERLNENENALADYDTVLKLDQEMLRALKNRGILRIKLDKIDEGIQDLLNASAKQYTLDRGKESESPPQHVRSKRIDQHSRPAALILDRKQFKRIDTEINRLLNHVMASFVGVIDIEGNLIGAAGILDDYDLQILSHALSIDHDAQNSLSALLKESKFHSIYFEGDKHGVYIIEFGSTTVVSLAVIAKLDVKAGMVWLYSKRAAAIIDDILKSLPPKFLPPSSQAQE